MQSLVTQSLAVCVCGARGGAKGQLPPPSPARVLALAPAAPGEMLVLHKCPLVSVLWLACTHLLFTMRIRALIVTHVTLVAFQF